jgi:hypothetical protein
MRPQFKVLVIAGALLAASLGGSASASAATSAPPGLITSNFACGNGVCEVGPGNVGVPFAAGLIGTGGPAYYGPECNPYVMAVISGSLPPGLQFGDSGCEDIISGTPAQAGTYAFTVQITPQVNNLGQPAGPSGTAQLTITIGTGGSDRLANVVARYLGHPGFLGVTGFDVNVGALYSVYVTSTGKVIFPPQSPPGLGFYGIDGRWELGKIVPDPCGRTNSCDLTVTDSLGSSITVTLPPSTY